MSLKWEKVDKNGQNFKFGMFSSQFGSSGKGQQFLMIF